MTALLINPGSGRVPYAGQGWTNTYRVAWGAAQTWLAGMRADGLVDVEIRDEAKTRDGRWVFTFVHRVTGVSVELETHGVDNMKAYKAEHIFPPRIYWNGSSSANPKLDDWSAPGFEPVCTFRPLPPVQERDEEGTDHV